MIESLSWEYLAKKEGRWNLLKKELLGEVVSAEDAKIDLRLNRVLNEHVWKMIDEMSLPIVPERSNGVAGYGEQFFGRHQQIHAQIKRLVDRVNIEMYL